MNAYSILTHTSIRAVCPHIDCSPTHTRLSAFLSARLSSLSTLPYSSLSIRVFIHTHIHIAIHILTCACALYLVHYVMKCLA
ncbi:hypothetical protein EON63_10620 [archaeon]|nr:MAG: hypothetical protein EON63_10620 [archaeon]